MRRTPFIQRTLSVLTGLLLAVAVSGLYAQSPTPEGTVITNTSTVTYTDANGNSYTPVTASVSVTVGFVAGVDLTGVASVSPASPSTADTLLFTYQNIGNGNDSISVSDVNSDAGTMVITGYRVNGTTYADLTTLNAALASILVAQNGTLAIRVIYNVPAGRGGLPSNYTMTAASRRTPSVTDAATTIVSPNLSAAVNVTPDGAQNLQQLPSNATNYTFTFTVQNAGNGPDNFNLVASHPGTAISIVSVNGTAGSSALLSGLASATSQTVAVVYTVLNVAAGSKDSLFLTATSVGNNTVSDNGFADLTVIMPSLTMAKEAYRNDKLTLITGSDRVLPGEFIQYKITVTNTGTAPSSVVQITDPLPVQLTYDSATGDAAGWTFSNAGNNVTADLTGTLAAGASRFIWVRAQVK
ncbi:MAG: hypothetical protein R2910_02055 [Gemmatimonadales bacterium]